jgi:hypothetical protein
MDLANCMWCEAEIRANCKVCPECSLESPVAPAAIASGASRRRKAATHGGRRLLLAIVAAPLLISFAYAAQYQILPASLVGEVPTAVADTMPQPPAAVTDPVQRGVWLNGMRAVRIALAAPDFTGFQQTYVIQSAGQLVSLCGTIPSGALNGMRFVSVAGDSARTVIEGRDPSFGTLWTRLCGSSDTV